MIDSLDAAKKMLITLAGTHSKAGDILSVAVTTSRLDDWRQSVPAYLNSEFGRWVKERDLAGEDKRRLQVALGRITDVLDYDVPATTQGLVAFSDGGPEIDEQIELPLRLTNSLVIGPWPYVRPLVNALSLLEPFILAEVSKDESSLYLVDEWGFAAENDLAGPWLRTSDRETGEVSIKKYYAAARQDGLVEQHHKEVAASLSKLLEMSGARRVVLSAQHDIAAAFRRALPAPLAGVVMAEISWDAAATAGQLVASARKAADQARQERMAALLDRISEGMGPGGHGVAGFDDVAGAIRTSRLDTLLVDRHRRAAGWACDDCFWVGLTVAGSCPICGGEPRATEDAFGELVRLTIVENGQVEVSVGLDKLDGLGGVAGLLRYA